MRTFSCFITDDRYSVPTLSFLVASDAQQAREAAERRLLESPHYRGVEVVEDGRPIYAIDRPRASEGRHDAG
jgi:hypothetical protein